MASIHYFVLFSLVYHNVFYDCAFVAVHHNHVDNNLERESDGAYRHKDHYNEAGHNAEFDHEAILGSVKEAEEFDTLSPEESKNRLASLLPRMDLNSDKYIDKDELRTWIMGSFVKLSREEAMERMAEADDNKDAEVSWQEYLQDSFGVDSEEEINSEDTGDTGMLIFEEKEMWTTADIDGNGKLNLEEFEVFTNPEEHEVMHPYLVNQTFREKDKNSDGFIDFQEYIGDKGLQHEKEWMISEKDRFDHELDVNNDGKLDADEVHKWVVPDNINKESFFEDTKYKPMIPRYRKIYAVTREIAEEEVEHLFASADDDHDMLLSYEEIVNHYDIFVGSEATDYGSDLLGERFDDEL